MKKDSLPLAEEASLRSEVTLEGWIFMVGLRVFDIGALIVWLVWFFRLREDDDDSDDGRGGGGNAPEPERPSGPSGGLDLPLAHSEPWPRAPARPRRRPASLARAQSSRRARAGAGAGADQAPLTAASCSVLGERLGEDLAATAPKARRFLLLEQPGPWTGRNAVTHSDLDEGVARALLARADEEGLKVHLIRRSSRRSALERRTVFVADTARDGPWLARHEIADPAEVLALDLDGGERWEEPVYAVCTHGKRDPCCARRGRPLARALRAARPEQTWEIGHIGGHRFAATFMAFPHGLTFGRVPAAVGPEIAAAYEAGAVDARAPPRPGGRPVGGAGGRRARAAPPGPARPRRPRRGGRDRGGRSRRRRGRAARRGALS